MTQDILGIDPTRYEALVATPLDSNIPAEMLLNLPGWCVDIETRR